MKIRELIAEELHKPARRHYPRRRVFIKDLNYYQSDLADLSKYSRVNKGMKFILVLINCLSKFVYAVPLKNKSGPEVAKALEPILKISKIKHLHTDEGKEYYNKHVQDLMKKYKINHYNTYSEMKASLVERVLRSLKGRMWKLFTSRGNYEWLGLLPKIVKDYNSTMHKTIGMKPKEVRKKHVPILLSKLYSKKMAKITSPKFKLDDEVRISKYKKVFNKGYNPSWSNEVFKIYAIKPTVPITYILQNSKGEILKGGFYTQELSKSKVGNVYLIEKVIRKKGNKVLVRWVGYDKNSDTWVDKKDIIK